MRMGMIVGTVVATRKEESLVGYKLLIVAPLNHRKEKTDERIVLIDNIGAGIGDCVLFVTGSVATRGIVNANSPIDAAVVGIIDTIDMNEPDEEER